MTCSHLDGRAAGYEPPAVSGGRVAAARVVAGLAAVFWGWLFFGVQDTLTVFVEGQDFASHYLMESGWGLLFLVLVAAPLIGIASQPRSLLLIAQVAMVGLAVIAGAVLTRSAPHLLPGLGLLATALVVAALARLDIRHHPPRLDLPLLGLVALAVVPALGYARRMTTSTGEVEKTVNLDHYPIQAALGIAIVLVAMLIAVARQWPSAWLGAATLVVTVAWMGIESVAYPHRLGSFGAPWGWLAFAWSLTFLVAALRPSQRRTRLDPSSS